MEFLSKHFVYQSFERFRCKRSSIWVLLLNPYCTSLILCLFKVQPLIIQRCSLCSFQCIPVLTLFQIPIMPVLISVTCHLTLSCSALFVYPASIISLEYSLLLILILPRSPDHLSTPFLSFLATP